MISEKRQIMAAMVVVVQPRERRDADRDGVSARERRGHVTCGEKATVA